MLDNCLYKENILVEASEVDFKKELRLSSLLRLFQGAATRELSLLGMNDHYIRSLSLHWVVSRYHIEIKRVPRYEERLLLETHAAPNRAMLFPRYFSLYDEKGDLIVRAGSVWALVDEKKRTMVFPDEYSIPSFGKLYGDEIPFSLSLHLPKIGNESSLKASYSFCDINGHINNCSYFDLLLNEIPSSFLLSHRVKEVDIQYKKEVMIDESVPLLVKEESNLYSFYSDRFLASILFEESK